MTCTVILTIPTGHAGLPLTVKKRDLLLGRSDALRRCCANDPPGDDVVSFSPQKRTAVWPTFAMRNVPLTWEPRTTLGTSNRASSLRTRGPGTSTVMNE